MSHFFSGLCSSWNNLYYFSLMLHVPNIVTITVGIFSMLTMVSKFEALASQFFSQFICIILQVIAEVLGGLSVESGADLQKVLRVDTCTSWLNTIKRLEAMLPIFRSRMGALLFLISALLSRGLVCYLLLLYICV